MGVAQLSSQHSSECARDVRLHEHVGLGRVEARGEVDGGAGARGFFQELRVVVPRGDGVEVDDAVEGVELVLHADQFLMAPK